MKNDAGSGSRARRARPQEGGPARTREPLPTRVQGLPELPGAYDEALRAGLAALGVRLPPGARAAIDGHVRLLLAWNRVINLTAVREPAGVALRHVVDSLAALPLLRAWGVEAFVDLGSGGGYPGIPLAAALGAGGLLVESVAKKAAFLRTALEATGLSGRLDVADRRAEAVAATPGWREAWPAVTARAVAPLAELVELAFPLLEPGGRLVAWKGAIDDDELAAGSRALRALGGRAFERHAVTAPSLDGHVLFVARKLRPTPAAFPRDPAARRRRRW